MSESNPGNGNGHKIAHHFYSPPEKVVSLVPSMTESIIELGFGSALVGVTDYCIYPKGQVEALPHLGGTKNPRVDEIIALRPDLVIANWEENTLQTVEALEAAGVRVWVIFPKTVRQALDVLWTLVGLFHNRLAAARVESMEVALDWAHKAAQQRTPVRYFCPIWFDDKDPNKTWWMTFNQQTYSHDLLNILGCENVFAKRERYYPLDADLGLAEPEDPAGRDQRFPRISKAELTSVDPDLILLPDEPYPFSEDHQTKLSALLPGMRSVKEGRICRLDGSLITWHGTRLAKALQIIPELIE